MLPPPSGEGLILQPRHGRESRTGKPTALKLAHQFNLPLQRHKRPSAGITLQDHHFFAHTSHSFSAIACMKRATSQGALRDVYETPLFDFAPLLMLRAWFRWIEVWLGAGAGGSAGGTGA
jgi:hypothetical protein